MARASKMITKFTYYNPYDHKPSNRERRLYCPSETYEIVDTSIGASIKASVPKHLTVLHELFPSERMNASVLGNKLRVYLVGSEQCPDMSDFSQSPINRIEFHGSICYERPVFEMISHLRGVQKVKFFLGCKQLSQFFCFPTNHFDKAWTNSSVTSLTILLEKKFSSKVAAERRDLMENIMERMILAFLNRSANCFPNLRKLTVDVPNTLKIKTAVFGLMTKLCYLKKTHVHCNDAGDRIIAKKVEEAPTLPGVNFGNGEEIASEGPDIQDTKPYLESCKSISVISEEQMLQDFSEASEDQQSVTDSDEKEDNPNISPTAGCSRDDTDEDNFELDQDESPSSPDNEESLTGLGKLLESMLGIRVGGLNEIARSSPEVPSSDETLLHDGPDEDPPILPVSNGTCTDITAENKNSVVLSPKTCDKSVSTEDYNDGRGCVDENDLQFDGNDESDAGISLDATMTLEMAQNTSPPYSLFQPEQLNPQSQLRFQPIAHHPLCYQDHEYLGIPIIPGFAISVNYSPAYLPSMPSHHYQQLQRPSMPTLNSNGSK